MIKIYWNVIDKLINLLIKVIFYYVTQMFSMDWICMPIGLIHLLALLRQYSEVTWGWYKIYFKKKERERPQPGSVTKWSEALRNHKN